MPPEDEPAGTSSSAAVNETVVATSQSNHGGTTDADAVATSQPHHRTTTKHGSDPEARVPFLAWFLVGGMGPPPKERNFMRMARERNEAGRRAEAYSEARKQALAERSKYLADWEKKWGPVGGAGLLNKVCGSNKKM